MKSKTVKPQQLNGYFLNTNNDAVTRVYVGESIGHFSRFARIAYVHGEWQGFVKGRGLVAFSPVRWKVVKAVVRLARAKVKALSKAPDVKPTRAVHNPENVSADKLPEGYRFLLKDEMESGKFCSFAILWTGVGRVADWFGPRHSRSGYCEAYTYAVPVKLPRKGGK